MMVTGTPVRGAGAWSAMCVAILILLLSGLPRPLPGQQAGDSALPRHALEVQALVEPEQVLRQLPAALAEAEQAGDLREQTLLWLARANACRVIADWGCQRESGASASLRARELDDPVLAARGLIAESRGSFALQDFSHGERLLGQAQQMLTRQPNAELAADIALGYSSLSHFLDKHESAVRYAKLGLAELEPGQAESTRARLLRNLARAQAQLGHLDEAQLALDQAVQNAAQQVDPKLSAELLLEQARVGRMQGDLGLQRRNGEQVLELARELTNSQLRGLGLEVLGLGALDAGDRLRAEQHLRAALDSFRELGLSRDELRVARELLVLLIDGDSARAEELVRRYLELDRSVSQSDRAKAADDYEARLRYAEQELELLRLDNEATLAGERARALEDVHRLSRWLVLLALAIATVLAVLALLQRRSNRRLREALAAVRESDARTSDLLRLSKGLVFLHDLRGELLMANPATAEALGQPLKALPGRLLQDFLADSQPRSFHDYLAQVVRAGHDDGVVVVRDGGGQLRHWRYSSSLSEAGSYVITNAVDISEQVREAEALREENLRDALTGAFNRRFLERFEERHGDAPWAVVNIDLDHFKRINDTLGHDAGDRALVEVTRFLEARVRQGDAVVRSGGDEFLILLADAEVGAVERLLDRLQRDMPQAPCAYSLGHAIRLGAETLAATMTRADQQMYQERRRRRAPAVE